jgi:hypothetical protein
MDTQVKEILIPLTNNMKTSKFVVI